MPVCLSPRLTRRLRVIPESEVDRARLFDLTDDRHNVVHLGRTAGEGAGSPVEPLYKLARGAPLLAPDEIQRAFGAKHGVIDVRRLRDSVRQQQDCVSALQRDGATRIS